MINQYNFTGISDSKEYSITVFPKFTSKIDSKNWICVCSIQQNIYSIRNPQVSPRASPPWELSVFVMQTKAIFRFRMIFWANIMQKMQTFLKEWNSYLGKVARHKTKWPFFVVLWREKYPEISFTLKMFLSPLVGPGKQSSEHLCTIRHST